MKSNWSFSYFSWFPSEDADTWFWAFNILPSISVDYQSNITSKWFQITLSFLFWQCTILYDNRREVLDNVMDLPLKQE